MYKACREWMRLPTLFHDEKSGMHRAALWAMGGRGLIAVSNRPPVISTICPYLA